jgi:formylglycine-generating enzyme required for sulfatase activity
VRAPVRITALLVALGLIGPTLLSCSLAGRQKSERPVGPVLTLTESVTEVPEPGPELLNPLIAMVEAIDDQGPSDIGSAIVVARDAEGVRLITARHVVIVKGSFPPRMYRDVSVKFWFDQEHSYRAQPTELLDPDLDLAVLFVANTEALQASFRLLKFDFDILFQRLRSPRALQLHDGLFTIGNPNGIPWYSAPFEPDRVLTVTDDAINFRSGFIAHGDSGGGLFSQDWYLLGMITADQPPGGRALRIDQILERLHGQGVPVDLITPVPPPPPASAFRDCDDVKKLRLVHDNKAMIVDAHVCPEMAALPGGEFRMGARPDEKGKALYNEDPRHPVSLRPFAIGKYEVTVAEYQFFVEETGHISATGCQVWTEGSWERAANKDWRDPGFPQDHRSPVVCVSWADAQAYAAWLGERTGKAYRLASEAEWEDAARAGTATRFWWGDHVADGKANCLDCGRLWDAEKPAPVGQFVPNFLGLYDMNGNVWEWVADCWHNSYSGAPPNGVAWTDQDGEGAEPGDCSKRVQRGGSWLKRSDALRSANRQQDGAGNRNSSVGFRVACDLEPDPADHGARVATDSVCSPRKH